MSTNAVQNSQQSYGGASFEPMAYDVDTIEPDAYPGEYEGEIVDGKFGPNSKNKPMITLEWKLNSTASDNDNCQKSVGSTLRDWITLANDKSGNPGKIALRTLRDAFGLDTDFSMLTPELVREFIAAIKGQTMTLFVVSSTDRDGNPGVRIRYTAPRGAGMAPMDTGEEAEEPPVKPAAKKTPTKAPAKKSAGRR
jgi:hypothetical protein